MWARLIDGFCYTRCTGGHSQGGLSCRNESAPLSLAGQNEQQLERLGVEIDRTGLMMEASTPPCSAQLSIITVAYNDNLCPFLHERGTMTMIQIPCGPPFGQLLLKPLPYFFGDIVRSAWRAGYGSGCGGGGAILRMKVLYLVGRW